MRGRRRRKTAAPSPFEALARPPEGKPGLWTVRFEAAGRGLRGVAFARTGASGFVTEPATARLLPGSVRATWVGDGDARALRVTGEAQVEAAATIASTSWQAQPRRRPTARGTASPGARPSCGFRRGKAPLALEIPASNIGAAKALHLDVRLLGLDPMGVAGRTELEIAE